MKIYTKSGDQGSTGLLFGDRVAKNDPRCAAYGEIDSAKRLVPEFELVAAGKGFVGILDDTSPKEEHEKYAEEATKLCTEKILSEKYDLKF